MNDEGATTHRRIVIRSMAIWLALNRAEIVPGGLRSSNEFPEQSCLSHLLVAWGGALLSNRIGVFTGSAIIILLADFVIQRIGAKRTSELLTVDSMGLLLGPPGIGKIHLVQSGLSSSI